MRKPPFGGIADCDGRTVSQPHHADNSSVTDACPSISLRGESYIMADSEASSRLRLGWVPEWEQRAPPARIPCRPPLRKPRSGARTERCLSYPLLLYSRASFPAVYNRSHICETECEAILEIYSFLDDSPVYLGEELRSIERGDTVQVVELGERLSDGGGTMPTVRLMPLRAFGLHPYEGSCASFPGDSSWRCTRALRLKASLQAARPLARLPERARWLSTRCR